MMDPVTSAALISGGGDMLTNLASQLLNDRGADRDRLKRFAEYLKSRMGQQVMSPGMQEQMVMRNQAAMAPQMNQFAEGLNKRLNLDSGVAQGALADRIFPQQMAMRNDLAMKNLDMTNQNDNVLRSLISQIYGNLAG